MTLPAKFDLEKFIELSLKPRSDKELATIFQVSPKTIVNWRRKPEVQEKIKQECTSNIYAYLPGIVRVLCKKALKGDIKAAGIVLELAGMNQLGNKEGTTSITVVIPQGININEPKTIEVNSGEKNLGSEVSPVSEENV